MLNPFYRYFLGTQPDQPSSRILAVTAATAGQRRSPALFHLTFCVIGERGERDPSQAARVEKAIAGRALSSIPIRLGRVRGGSEGAMVGTIGKQEGIQHFYRMLVSILEAHGIAPLYRKSGLRPHVTLGYEPCRFDPFDIALEWSPQELLLIESEVGRSKHHVVGRWPLLPPAQGSLLH